ncbi:MAG TPA: hypothetical protein VHZ81_00250 [Galbitalea sp.]|nr:hypothetical protein [Galbitalea sp.]
MTNPLRTARPGTRGTRAALVAIAGASVVGALAGCSATPSAGTPGEGSGSTSGNGAGATTISSTTTYKDGTYSEPGDYVSPGGSERINVTLTLSKNVITKMKVVTVFADPTATGYEHLFEGGISAATVGKNINTLNIGVVAGSSLTSMGFNKALAAIKADAKS